MKYKAFYEKGVQIIPNVLDQEKINFYKKKILEVYKKQVEEFGIEYLKITQEENIVRSPFLYDSCFIELFYNDTTKCIVSEILGEYAILSLQNAIFIPPKHIHHQTHYHRDLIHQEFTSSIPLSINLYYCLDDYDVSNGGTTFIFESHKKNKLQEKYKDSTPNVSAGSIILFDSMVYHKAGLNFSDQSRFGINNMFTLPFVKQQIRYPFCYPKTDDVKLNRILGFESREYDSVKHFREYRLGRLKNE